jgi:hypothetical protein
VRGVRQYERADSIRLSEVAIDGDTARATAKVHGGSYDGFTVELEFVEQDGRWRANRIVRYLGFDRATFERNYRRKFAQFGSPERAADCAIRKSRRLALSEIQRIILSGEAGPWSRYAAACDRPGIERSLLRAYNEDEALPRSVSRCVEGRIRSMSTRELARVSDSEIGFGTVLLNCDRASSFAYLRHSLEEGDDVETEAIPCVVAALTHRPAAETIRLTYDGPAYADLIDGCEG